MDNEERVDALHEAQTHILEAVQLIKDVVKGTEEEQSAMSYIIPHLENWAEGHNQNDFTAIPRLIERFQLVDKPPVNVCQCPQCNITLPAKPHNGEPDVDRCTNCGLDFHEVIG